MLIYIFTDFDNYCSLNNMALTSEKPWRATKKSNFCQYYKTYSRTALLAKIENIYRIEIGCFIQFYAILFVTEINK